MRQDLNQGHDHPTTLLNTTNLEKIAETVFEVLFLFFVVVFFLRGGIYFRVKIVLSKGNNSAVLFPRDTSFRGTNTLTEDKYVNTI